MHGPANVVSHFSSINSISLPILKCSTIHTQNLRGNHAYSTPTVPTNQHLSGSQDDHKTILQLHAEGKLTPLIIVYSTPNLIAIGISNNLQVDWASTLNTAFNTSRTLE